MKLKEQPGGDMVVGGADLAASFVRHDLVDEYRIYLHPIVHWTGPTDVPAFGCQDQPPAR